MIRRRIRFASLVLVVCLAACGGSTSPADNQTQIPVSCPASAPKEGATSARCPLEGLECEYGPSADPSCNALVICSAQAWASTRLGACTTSPECPTSYAQAPGASCTASDTCAYLQGQCICIGGADTTLNCTTPQPGCPSIRPHIGSACDEDSQQCTYGVAVGFDLVCLDGVWRRAAFQGG